jgi:hypothetical protein
MTFLPSLLLIAAFESGAMFAQDITLYDQAEFSIECAITDDLAIYVSNIIAVEYLLAEHGEIPDDVLFHVEGGITFGPLTVGYSRSNIYPIANLQPIGDRWNRARDRIFARLEIAYSP